VLCLPGRGTRLKNHAAAVRVLAAVRAAGIDAGLLLLGAADTGRDGYLAEVQALAAELGVADRIAITAQRADIADVYAAVDLVLQLSTKPEAFGRTVVEALAVGTPVVGYAHGGVGELLDALYPAGRVPAGDEAALAHAVLDLLAGAPPVPPVRDYTLAAMQAGELAVYAEVVAGRRA
jgi:glycosyltransferase involved in cell wall biosynthesis